MRNALRVVVLLAWAGMMAAQVVRGSRGGQAGDLAFSRSSRPPLPATASEHWFGIYRNEEKVGYAVQRRTPVEDGFRVEDQALLKLAVMGAARVVRTEFAADTDRRLALRRFTFTLHSGPIRMEVEGEAEPDGIALTIGGVAGSEPRKLRVPLAAPPVLPQTLHGVLGREKIVEGAVYRYPLLDPMSGAPTTVELEVGKSETITLPEGDREAFRVTQRLRGSRFTLWVGNGGEVLREEGPLGLTLVRELPQRARSGLLSEKGLDLGAAAAITAGATLPSPRTVERLELRVGGFPDDLLPSFPPRQSLTADRLTIASALPATLPSVALPGASADFAADLAPTPFLQSDDAGIRALAAEIVGDERDARRVAQKILDWVHREIAKVPSATWPSAVEVLRSRQGDCNEHAVLFGALARAAGLPARVVAGVVYVGGDEGLPDAFYYHAWNEVWIGDWVAVDAVFGQMPADATHVQFLAGGPERHVDLVRLLGEVSLTILDSEKSG